MMKLLSFSLYSCTVFSASLSIECLAVEPMDQYYADDLIEAVDQAREQPHHYDYSGTYRYKRTTAQSIELNRLDLGELDDTRLEMNAGKTDNKDAEHFSEDGQTNDQLFDKKSSQTANINMQNKSLNISGPALPQSGYYKAGHGEYRTTGIRSEGIVISTPRP